MRTALPAPAFLADARAARREVKPEDCALCSPQAPYHVVAGRHRGEVTILEARNDPNAFAEYVARRGPDPAWPSLRSAWHDHFAKSQPSRLILAPAGAGMSGQLSTWRTKLDALWLARHLAENPGARVSIISASERGADQLIQATKRAWNQQSLGDRLLEQFRGAPPDPEAQAYIDAHAVDDLGLGPLHPSQVAVLREDAELARCLEADMPRPTLEQRLAAVQDGIWRDTIRRIADERGW